VIKDLVLYPKNMLKNLNQTNGLYFSQSILLALTQEGMERENAYALVQKIAMQAWEKNEDFKKYILENKEIKGILSKTKIESIFDIKKQLQNVEYIFERVF
jgi:adenylosuccinate lyase